jgi:hypothetical protein
MSRKSPDRRLPCGGVPPLTIGGCRKAEKNLSISAVPSLVNTTKQKDYASENYITPYRNPEQETAPDCSEFSSPYICNDGLGNGYPYCGVADPSLFQYTDLKFEVGSKYYNSYVPSSTGETGDYSACENIGAKRVYAKKSWSGRRGFTSRTLFGTDKMDWCSNCQVHDYDPTPDTTKYLALSANASISHKVTLYTTDIAESGEWCCSDGCVTRYCHSATADSSYEYSGKASNQVHVDRFGNFYVDGVTNSATIIGVDDEGGTIENEYKANAWTLLGKANLDITAFFSGDGGGLYAEFRSSEAGQPVPSRITGTENNFSLEWDDTVSCDSDPCFGNFVESTYVRHRITIDLAANRIEQWVYAPFFPRNRCDGDSNCNFEIIQTLHEFYQFSATSMEYFFEARGEQADSTTHDVSSVTCTLSSPYTSADVQTEMRNLLGYYPLDDDILLPWRTALDGGPLVSYDEGISVPVAQATDSNIPFSGRIMGKPAPRGIDYVGNPSKRITTSAFPQMNWDHVTLNLLVLGEHLL